MNRYRPLCRFALPGTLAAALVSSTAALAYSPAPEHCESLSLISAGTQAFEPIQFSLANAPDGEWLLKVDQDGVEPLILTANVVDGLGQAILPLPPSGDPAGGPVVIRFGQWQDDAIHWCENTYPMIMAGLIASTSSGQLATELGLLRELLDDLLEDLGWTGETLAAADPASLDGPALILWGPARLAFGTDGIEPLWAGLPPEDQDLADALVEASQQGRSPQPETLGDWPDPPPPAPEGPFDPPDDGPDWPGWPEPDDGAPPEGDRPGNEPPGNGDDQGADEGSGPEGGDPQDAPESPEASPSECHEIDIPTLGFKMGRQVSGTAMQSGAGAQTLAAGQTIGSLPVVSRVGMPTALLAWAVNFASQYQQHTQPSIFEDVWIEHSPQHLNEDDVDGGHVTEVGLRFSSQGFDMGPLIADLAVMAAGEAFGRSVGAASAAHSQQVAAAQMARGVERAAAMPMSAAQSALLGELAGWAYSLELAGAIDASGMAEGVFTVEPECWNAREPVGDPLEEHLRLHFTRAIQPGNEANHFVASSTGSGRIDARIDVPVGQGIVGSQLSASARNASHTFGVNEPVEVRSLTVSLTPGRADVRPGQAVDLTLRLSGANDQRVEITDSLDELRFTLDNVDEDTLRYVVPDDHPEGQTIVIQARSLAETGLRQPGHPRYRGALTAESRLRIEPERLYLDPPKTCVRPREEVRYQALDDPLTGNPVDVDWTVSDGRIDNQGRFRAPSGEGRVVLTATARHRSDLTASWGIDIDDCRISWQATLSGSDAPVPLASGNRGAIEVRRMASAPFNAAVTHPENPQPRGPFLTIRLAPAAGANPEPPRDATPAQLRAFIQATEHGHAPGMIPEFTLIVPATQGQTGRFVESFVHMGMYDSRADYGAAASIADHLVNGYLRTAVITLDENSPRRLSGRFEARLLPDRNIRPRRTEPVIVGPGAWDALGPGSGLLNWPDEEIQVSGHFDFRLDE